MNLDELISRATHTSGRSLLALGSAILLLNRLDVSFANLPIIKHAIGDGNEKVAVATAFVLLISLLITHFLNWFNDWIGYQAFFPISEVKSILHPDNISAENVDRKEIIEVFEKHKTTIRTAKWAQIVSLYGQHLALPIGAAGFALALVSKEAIDLLF